MGTPILVGGFTRQTQQKSEKAIEPVTSLTGIETASDAWGKIIPLTFGRTRVPGVLVWASEFYKTTSGFDTTVTTFDQYTQNYNVLRDPSSIGHDFASTVTTTDVTTQTTRTSINAVNIDLCYSFGKEGDKRRKRYVDVIRINEIEVYNSQTGYVAPNIGFNIRYGYDNSIDPLMAKYANGDLLYKDQTLIIFNKFPTGDFGDAVPQSIDVEFGCLPSELEIYPCLEGGCGYSLDLDRHITRSDGLDRIAPGEVKWSACHIILITLAVHNGDEGQGNNNIELPDTLNAGIITFSEGYVTSRYHVVTEAEAREWNKNGVQLITAANRPGTNLCTGRVRVFQIGAGFRVNTRTFQDPTEDVYTPRNWNGPGLVFRDAFVYAKLDGSQTGVVTSPDPVIAPPSTHIQQTSHKTIIEDNTSQPDGGQVTCPGRVYFAVMSTRISFTPCAESL